MIYLKVIQGILGKLMLKRKGEVVIWVKLSVVEYFSYGEGLVRSEGLVKIVEGVVRSVIVIVVQKEKDVILEVSMEEDKIVLERSSFYDRRVVIDF